MPGAASRRVRRASRRAPPTRRPMVVVMQSTPRFRRRGNRSNGSVWTRVVISSRIGRTASTLLPAGSSNLQYSYRCPGRPCRGRGTHGDGHCRVLCGRPRSFRLSGLGAVAAAMKTGRAGMSWSVAARSAAPATEAGRAGRRDRTPADRLGHARPRAGVRPREHRPPRHRPSARRPEAGGLIDVNSQR